MGAGLLVKLASNLLIRLATEAFAAKVIVYTLSEVSKKTTNQLDDKLVSAISEALGVSTKEG